LHGRTNVFLLPGTPIDVDFNGQALAVGKREKSRLVRETSFSAIFLGTVFLRS
jgi:hypothetical protein